MQYVAETNAQMEMNKEAIQSICEKKGRDE